MKSLLPLVCCVVAWLVPARGAELSPLEELGKRLFFDKNLSTPAGQSCASCHAPETGFSGPDSETNRRTAIYPGADRAKAGNRKPPSAAYMSFSPKRSYNAEDETFVGGQFWDGRADDLVAQAKGPLLNSLEMNNASAGDVVQKVARADYRGLFEEVYGAGALDAGPQHADAAFDQIARAIAAYESSREVNAFSSKYDAWLAGQVELTAAERRGLALYEGKAKCKACHPHRPAEDGSPPLFTDFTYDNVGAPANPANPFYLMPPAINPDGAKYRDLGIGVTVNDKAHWGKFKVPTLRNVAKRPDPEFVKAYLHNGVFKSLREVVHFYNVRLTAPHEFPLPDVSENVNVKEFGALKLTAAEEQDLVTFLETLSDGYWTPQAEPETALIRDPRQTADDFIRVRRFMQRRLAAERERGAR